MQLAAGQSWTYRAPEGYEASRLVIGAIVTFDSRRAIVCASALGVPRRHQDGSVETVVVPFIPMTEAAFRQSVVDLDGAGEPPEAFAQHLQNWSDDPRGLTTFTVPFEGHLDRMIALQMAEIAGQSAA